MTEEKISALKDIVNMLEKETVKEAIKRLKDILEKVTETYDSVCYVTSDDADVIKLAIKALEQTK